MAVLRLSPANLTSVERSLRTALPDVNPAHLVEALASALGEKSYATLHTRIAAQTEQEVVALDGTLWIERLAEFGYKDVTASPLRSAVRDRAIPDPCWREFKKRDIAGANGWFRECKRDDIPCIVIRRARKYVYLSWDCISTSGRDDDQVRGESSGDLCGDLFTTFQQFAKHDPNRSTFDGTAFVGTMKGLLPPMAHDIADAFFVELFQATRAKSARSPALI